MPAKSDNTSASKSAARARTRSKVQRHRDRLRAQGLRPIQIWVPDVDSPAFIKEARRQSLLAAQSPYAAEDQAFIDSISIWNDDEAW